MCLLLFTLFYKRLGYKDGKGNEKMVLGRKFIMYYLLTV